MALSLFAQIAIAIAINIVAYLITPRPKQTKPEISKDLIVPTAEAGRPIPVAFGPIRIQGVNVLWYGDKDIQEVKVSA